MAGAPAMGGGVAEGEPTGEGMATGAGARMPTGRGASGPHTPDPDSVPEAEREALEELAVALALPDLTLDAPAADVVAREGWILGVPPAFS